MPEVIRATIEILGVVAILGMAAIALCAVLFIIREFWRSW